jgi:hypothetical protein
MLREMQIPQAQYSTGFLQEKKKQNAERVR